jgi:hypothetical protein
MSAGIARREDVNSSEGLHESGNVEFADETNHTYPIDTPEHVRAAWSYINHRDYAEKYDPDEGRTIKTKIEAAAQKQGVKIDV